MEITNSCDPNTVIEASLRAAASAKFSRVKIVWGELKLEFSIEKEIRKARSTGVEAAGFGAALICVVESMGKVISRKPLFLTADDIRAAWRQCGGPEISLKELVSTVSYWAALDMIPGLRRKRTAKANGFELFAVVGCGEGDQK